MGKGLCRCGRCNSTGLIPAFGIGKTSSFGEITCPDCYGRGWIWSEENGSISNGDNS